HRGKANGSRTPAALDRPRFADARLLALFALQTTTSLRRGSNTPRCTACAAMSAPAGSAPESNAGNHRCRSEIGQGLLAKHVGPITLTPKNRGSSRWYEASGAFDLSVVLKSDRVLGNSSCRGLDSLEEQIHDDDTMIALPLRKEQHAARSK